MARQRAPSRWLCARQVSCIAAPFLLLLPVGRPSGAAASYSEYDCLDATRCRLNALERRDGKCKLPSSCNQLVGGRGLCLLCVCRITVKFLTTTDKQTRDRQTHPNRHDVTCGQAQARTPSSSARRRLKAAPARADPPEAQRACFTQYRTVRGLRNHRCVRELCARRPQRQERTLCVCKTSSWQSYASLHEYALLALVGTLVSVAFSYFSDCNGEGSTTSAAPEFTSATWRRCALLASLRLTWGIKVLLMMEVVQELGKNGVSGFRLGAVLNVVAFRTALRGWQLGNGPGTHTQLRCSRAVRA